MSAWTAGPERITPIKKEPLTIYDDEATFYPDMVSNEVLRDQVQSSGYGYELPGVDPEQGTPFQPASNSRIREELERELTFHPQLVQTPAAKHLRTVARSSGYGKRVPDTQRQRKQKENQAKAARMVTQDGRPLFQPQLNRPKGSKRPKAPLVPSCYYTVKKPVKQDPKPTFKPKMTQSKLAKRIYRDAPSAQYGKKEVTQKTYIAGEDGSVKRVPYVRQEPSGDKPMERYTLLKDRSYVPKRESSPENEFVLDCVKVAHQDPLLAKFVARNSPIKEYHAMPKPNRQPKVEGASSRYGKEIPHSKIFVEEDGFVKEQIVDPVTERLEREAAREAELEISGQWAISKKANDAIEGIDSYTLQEESLDLMMKSQAKIADVPSKGYGKVFPQPERKIFVEENGFVKPKIVEVVKKEPELLAPFLTPKRSSDSFGTPEPAPPNEQTNQNVESHKYGRASPAFVPRPWKEPAPVWLPPSRKAEVPPPPPPERNSLTDQVLSHYGPDYLPEDSEAYYDDDGADDGDDNVDYDAAELAGEDGDDNEDPDIY